MRLTQASLFTFILVLYYILTMLFPNIGYSTNQSSERIYPQLVMGLIGIYSLLITAYNLKKICSSKILRPFIYYLLISLLYIFWVNKSSSLFDNFIYVIKFDMAILVMFVFYIFLQKERKQEYLQKLIYILFIVQFFYSIETLIFDKFFYQSKNDFLNSNSGFNLIALIPLTLVIPKPRIKIYFYFIIFAACLFTGQRSAALAAVISLPFCLKYLKKDIRKSDILFLTILGIIALYPVINMAIENIMHRMQLENKTDNGIGSGRSIFWGIIFNQFFKNDLFHILFGNGYFSVSELLKHRYGMAIEAHNGWLQNLYVFGIFGFLFYIRTIFTLLSSNRIINKIIPKFKNVFLILFIILFLKASTSHGNWDISMIPFALVISIIANKIESLKRYILYENDQYSRRFKKIS